MVEDVRCLHAELEAIVVPDWEAAEDPHIEVPIHRAAEEVSSGITPLISGLRERRRIVVHRVRPCRSDLLNRRNLLDRLLTGPLVERGVVAANRERQT